MSEDYKRTPNRYVEVRKVDAKNPDGFAARVRGVIEASPYNVKEIIPGRGVVTISLEGTDHKELRQYLSDNLTGVGRFVIRDYSAPNTHQRMAERRRRSQRK